MKQTTITPAELDRILEKLERLEKGALSQQMEACARNCQALEDRVRELEAELEMMHEINVHVAEKVAKEIRHKAADIVIQIKNAEMAGKAHSDIINIQTPKP